MDIRLRHITKSYQDTEVFSDWSAVFREGICTAVMGPSGCGKTTLLRMILGLERADDGSIAGVPRKLSAVFQEDRLCMELSAVMNIEMVLAGKAKRDFAREHLRELGIPTEEEQNVSALSGGMKRRVAIARAVLADFDLLVMDEPFQGLDGQTKHQTMQYVKKHTAGKTVLLVTHDETEAAFIADEILRISG